MERWSRRQFVQLATVGTVAWGAGCTVLSPSDSTENNSRTTGDGRPTQRSAGRSGPISGRVVRPSGDGIADARIDAIVTGRGSVAETNTDQQGRFDIQALRNPVWLRATASDFVPRTVAVPPEASRRIQLTPREGTVSLSFGGDVMFGHRFYEDDDPLEPHFQIRTNDRKASRQSILQYISPLLEDADVTSVNLETPLTTTERVPLVGPTTLLALYRHETDSRLELLVRWYESLVAQRSLRCQSISTEQPDERSLETPKKANYIRFYFRLYPPDDGDAVVVRFDDIRLIEWNGAGAGGGKEYDHLRLRGAATIEFTTSGRSNEEISWVDILPAQ
ncbi:MAG: carboxypeptidase regulatory-like domain-containing protein [Halovenus sp.]